MNYISDMISHHLLLEKDFRFFTRFVFVLLILKAEVYQYSLLLQYNVVVHDAAIPGECS